MPANGPVGGGTTLTITGQLLAQATLVSIGGALAYVHTPPPPVFSHFFHFLSFVSAF
jgi:hypothetical protein